METIYFAAGCFWGVQDKFKNTPGVIETSSGYMGGSVENPTYKQVCTGDTGHAEVVEVKFDSQVISLEQLLGIFWDLHDPTSLNKQGPDLGTQYRSAIFYTNEEQLQLVNKSKDLVQPKFKNQIVTEVTLAPTFYPAEEYHQCYLEKNGKGSCKL